MVPGCVTRQRGSLTLRSLRPLTHSLIVKQDKTTVFLSDVNSTWTVCILLMLVRIHSWLLPVRQYYSTWCGAGFGQQDTRIRVLLSSRARESIIISRTDWALSNLARLLRFKKWCSFPPFCPRTSNNIPSLTPITRTIQQPHWLCAHPNIHDSEKVNPSLFTIHVSDQPERSSHAHGLRAVIRA